MRKIAIIAPCILPVPAVKGGAVEELITCIINQNEISKHFAIDLFTIADSSYAQFSYSNTNIIPIDINNYSYSIDKILDKSYRTFGTEAGVRRFIDKKIIQTFLHQMNSVDGGYYAVNVENQMSLVIELLNAIGESRDYPIYFHMHNDVDIYRSPQYIRRLVENGVQILAVSEYIGSQIKKQDRDAVVHLLYNGVSMDAYSMTTRKNDGFVKFLYSGRIIPTKGVYELVQAFKNLSLDNVSLDIIGFSDDLTAYEKKVMKAVKGLQNKISCHKRIPTALMAEKYNEYDVVVMPTLDEEPFGLVALETIAKGIPLITTNSGAIPEIVGDAAIIVDKNNDFIDELTKEMELLAKDTASRQELGKKAFLMARSVLDFHIDGYYDRLVSVLVSKKIKKEKISVIIPVYNVVSRLEKCLESITHQSYENIEIVVIDDGSTDGSGDICDTYSKNDSRIKVIHQDNHGLSYARNVGIEKATGDYLFFLDSDDYLRPDTLSFLIEQMTRCKADISACGVEYLYDDGHTSPFTNERPGIWSGKEAVTQMMRSNNLCSIACNKLYKSELWSDVRFPEGKLHEDEATIYKVLYKSNIVTYTPNCFYRYYQRTDSITKENIANRYQDYIVAIEERIDFFESKDEAKLVQHSVLTLLEYIKYAYRNTCTDKVMLAKKYKEIINEKGIPKEFGIRKQIALLLWTLVQY